MFYIQFKKIFGWKSEQIAHFRSFCSFRSNQMSDVSESLISLKSNERFAQVPQRKSAIVSKLLRSLTKNEWMSELLIFWANCSFARFWTKNERFARKSNEPIPSPAKIIPDLWLVDLFWPIKENFHTPPYCLVYLYEGSGCMVWPSSTPHLLLSCLGAVVVDLYLQYMYDWVHVYYIHSTGPCKR